MHVRAWRPGLVGCTRKPTLSSVSESIGFCSAQKRLSRSQQSSSEAGRLFAMETRAAFAESRALFGLCCFRCFQQSVWYRSLMLQTASGRVVAFNILWNICPHDWEETEPPPQARPSPILPVPHPLFCQLLIQKNSGFSILLTACCSNAGTRRCRWVLACKTFL